MTNSYSRIGIISTIVVTVVLVGITIALEQEQTKTQNLKQSCDELLRNFQNIILYMKSDDYNNLSNSEKLEIVGPIHDILVENQGYEMAYMCIERFYE